MQRRKLGALRLRRPHRRLAGGSSKKRAIFVRKHPSERLVQFASLSMLRHELRTPLTGILGMSELLQNSGLAGEQRGYLEALQASGRQMERLIRQATLWRQEPGPGGFARSRPIDGMHFLEQIIRAHWPAALKKGIGLYLVYDHRLTGHWYSDAVCLRQLLDNLIANAIKFTQSGFVLVQARPSGLPQQGGSDIELRVSDTGIGIDRRDGRSIYQAHKQGSGGIYGRFGGSGLGLFVCDRNTTLLGGSIGHTANRGGGTCFRVVLPSAALFDQDAASRFHPALLNGFRCQLGLDGPGRLAVTHLLRRIGARVSYAGNNRIHRLPIRQDAVICNSERIAFSISGQEAISNRNAIVLLSRHFPPSPGEGEDRLKTYVVELSQPILQSNLEPILLQLALQRAVSNRQR